MKYSIIIPVYNRTIELECCLFCLSKQTLRDFEVIICDDGSSEDTLSLVRKMDKTFGKIKYFWQPDKGFRAGQARNRGVDLMDKTSGTIIFLDSDIIFREDWLATYDRITKAHPDCIICGRYDFLLPTSFRIRVENVAHDFDKVVSNAFPILRIPWGEFFGKDMRKELFQKDKEEREKTGKNRIVTESGGALFGGNTLMPKAAFQEIGGFDENIIRHGGEDSDLGQTAQEKGIPFIFSEQPMAWHIYHQRDQEKNKKDLVKNIIYIDKSMGRRAKIVDCINFLEGEIEGLKKGEVLIEELSKADITVKVEKLSPEEELGLMVEEKTPKFILSG